MSCHPWLRLLPPGLEVMLPDSSSFCWHPECVAREPSGTTAQAPLSRVHGPSPTIANPTFLSPSVWTYHALGTARGAFAEHSAASPWVGLCLDVRLAQRLVGSPWPHSRSISGRDRVWTKCERLQRWRHLPSGASLTLFLLMVPTEQDGATGPRHCLLHNLLLSLRKQMDALIIF